VENFQKLPVGPADGQKKSFEKAFLNTFGAGYDILVL